MLSFFANFIDDQSNTNPQKPKKLNPMKTDQQPEPTTTVFLQTVSVAVMQLKQQLQQDYEQAYPDLREIVHLVLDEEETNAWDLTLFPHLLLPDLVEAHIAKLNLQPADTRLRNATARQARHGDLLAPHRFPEIDDYQPAFARCG
jgi:hypothetical protein